jgi:hypothetical protein
MWELTGAQALNAFLECNTAINTMLITDTSVHRWSALLHLCHHGHTTTSHTTTCSWPFDNNYDQAHREAFATPQALVHGHTLIQVSGCLCIVYAQQAGSGKSPQLQQEAEQVYHKAYKVGYHITSTWIARVEMLENGVHHLSSKGTFDPHETTLTSAA